ncbi:MAG: DUF11 domain-containing protein, partial [Alphaproteobacteria bacterium]|nr:DUF11 domain-containing protein [Alphaproteobacteria bacterium]
MRSVEAQTISNTANIQWQVGATTLSQPSNQVNVLRQAAPSATLSLFQFTSTPGQASFTIPATTCQSSNGATSVKLAGAYAGTSVTPAVLAPVTMLQAGTPLVISVMSPADNLNPNAIDTLNVRLSTPEGDVESLTLQETGDNTGVFVGMINTSAIPPTPVQGDCVLSVQPGDSISVIATRPGSGATVATNKVNILIDPYGISFDSGTGAPVAGTKVTLINAATGQPATVYGDDGVSSFPATVITGSTVTDSSGNSYSFPTGDYRFPLVKPGSYKLLIQPAAPYTAPSSATAAQLSGFRRPDGQPYAISGASYGQTFTLTNPAPVRIDIPIDKPGAGLVISKTVSNPVAAPGDSLQYMVTLTNPDPQRTTGNISLTDVLPLWTRLAPNTVRVNGIKAAYTATPDGKRLLVPLVPLAPGASDTITYVLGVRSDAQPGNITNMASAQDDRGTKSAIAAAAVQVTTAVIGDTMTIIGRVTDGGCSVDPRAARGIGGVRVMMEDGSYAVTDSDGRYHFDGVLPGTHVVQVDPSTYPGSRVPVDCSRNTRTAGSAISRFVNGGGGALLRADFYAALGRNKARVAASTFRHPSFASDQEAAGTNRDWIGGEAPGIDWLFPDTSYNPRTRATRVVIKHLPGQTVTLFADGKPVNALSFDGEKKSGDGQVEVSIWRAVDLGPRDTLLSADVKDAHGQLVKHLERRVHFAASALHAEFLPGKSFLIADGVNRPVIAMRLTDRDGRPIHHGQVGDFSLSAPYTAAIEADAQAARGLSGLERGKPVWRVEGDDGVAYIELEPTTASGSLIVTLPLKDGDVATTQQLDAWLSPGKRPWTIVGLAEGTVGFNRLDHNMQTIPDDGSTLQTDGRIALYAKGLISGKWLLTLAYDSAKNTANTQYGSAIDPNTYYTVYADRSQRRFDASSVRKLYLKLERKQFYALFGDYDTGITDPQLARYVRALNGVKSEYRSNHVAATAFAAQTPYSHRREE